LVNLLFKKLLNNDKLSKKELLATKFSKTEISKDFAKEKNELKALIDEAYSPISKTE